MDITGLKREPDAVAAVLKKKQDKSIIVTGKVQVTYPQVFIQDNLVDVGDTPAATALFGIIVDDKYYACSSVLAKMVLTPDETTTYTVDNETYVLHTFYPGGTLTENCSLVVENTLVYYTYKTILSKGYVPWYFNVANKTDVFKSAKRHANVNINCNRAIPAIHSALLARSPKDVTKQWRHVVKTQEEFDTVRPVFIGASNVSIAIEGTIPNIGGSYASEGLVGAMTKPSYTQDPLEKILTGKFNGDENE